MVEDMKKGQPEVNILDQKKWCYSKAEEIHHHQTQKTSSNWKTSRLRSTKYIEGPRLHVRFVLFCCYLYQSLIV